MKLSPHFDLSEMITSREAVSKGIDNTPTEEIIENLRWWANNMEAVRAELGHPIVVTSGYRCQRLNEAVGGVLNSDHVYGLAGDFICPGFGTPAQICDRLAFSGIPYKQLILEYDAWVHMSFPPPGVTPRRQRLRKVYGVPGYLDGFSA